jgi:hypothetical protein
MTFSYKTYADGTGWHYDNRAYLQEVAEKAASWSKREVEHVAVEATATVPFQ